MVSIIGIESSGVVPILEIHKCDFLNFPEREGRHSELVTDINIRFPGIVTILEIPVFGAL